MGAGATASAAAPGAAGPAGFALVAGLAFDAGAASDRSRSGRVAFVAGGGVVPAAGAGEGAGRADSGGGGGLSGGAAPGGPSAAGPLVCGAGEGVGMGTGADVIRGVPWVRSRSSGVPRSNCRNSRVARPITATPATARSRQKASLAAWGAAAGPEACFSVSFEAIPIAEWPRGAIKSGPSGCAADVAAVGRDDAAARACASTASRSAGEGRASSSALASR